MPSVIFISGVLEAVWYRKSKEGKEGKGMKDQNQPQRVTRILYRALPELEDQQELVITAEVDVVLHLLGEHGYITPAQFQQTTELSTGSENPHSSLAGKKHLLATLLRKQKLVNLPPEVFAPLLRIAVYEANPSFNRGFIEPCLRAFGYRKVLEALLDYLRHGTNREKAGSARALYWAQLPIILPSWEDRERKWQNQEELQQALQEFHQERLKAEQDFQQIWDGVLDVRKAIFRALLKEFVENANLDVQRSIIPGLSLNPSKYPDELKPLVLIAARLAQDHADDYIRHRGAIQQKSVGTTDA